MPHADQIANIARRHDGVMPATWFTGDTDYQKATVLATVAWHDIKAADDPELTDCDLTHRENCIGIAESIMRGNQPDDLPFSQAVARRWAEVNQPPTKEMTAP